jgi:hypothetical protein
MEVCNLSLIITENSKINARKLVDTVCFQFLMNVFFIIMCNSFISKLSQKPLTLEVFTVNKSDKILSGSHSDQFRDQI